MKAIVETLDPADDRTPVLAYRMPREAKTVKNSLEDESDYKGLVAHLRTRRKNTAKDVIVVDTTAPEVHRPLVCTITILSFIVGLNGREDPETEEEGARDTCGKAYSQ